MSDKILLNLIRKNIRDGAKDFLAIASPSSYNNLSGRSFDSGLDQSLHPIESRKKAWAARKRDREYERRYREGETNQTPSVQRYTNEGPNGEQ